MKDASASVFSAVVFDIDGTLLDSAGDIADALNGVLAEARVAALSDADVRPLIGGSIESTVERAFESAGQALDAAGLERVTADFLERYRRKLANRSTLYPGVAETLDGLLGAGYRLGVCSNKPHAALGDVLDAFALARRFQAVVGAGASEALKPHPAPYFQVLRALGARAEASVLVGDSETDVKTARAAGARVIVVPWGYTDRPAAALGADAVIGDLSELMDTLQALS